MNSLNIIWKLILVIFTNIFFSLSVNAQCPYNCPETYEERQRRYNDNVDAYTYSEERRRKRQQEINDGDDGGLILLGALLIGGAIYSAHQSSTYHRSRYYNSRYRRRFVPRPPGFILGGSLALHKNRINEHWQRGLSGDLKAEFLILGSRGKYPNIGLYANGSISNYQYQLPFSEDQYYLGHDFVEGGDPTLIYKVNSQVPEEDKNAKFIALNERSKNVGLSLKTFFKGAVFLDVGAGVKIKREVSVKFAEGYRYLGGNYRIKRNTFRDVVTTENKPYLFDIKNSFLDFGIGKMFRGKKSPFYVKLSGKLFQLDYSKTDVNKIYLRNDQVYKNVNIDSKLGYSINIEVAMLFGRFMK